MPRIDAKTKVCALFGHPVGHSRSPEIHNAAFEALQLPFVYVAHDVLPGQVGQALQGVRAMGYRGLSVTIPHKVEAMQGVDEVDGIAQGIGCINTVVNDGGRLTGYNSDGLGALGALRDAGADPRGTRTVILGSGGAARAIAVTIAAEAPPAQLTILGVVPDELERLVGDVRQRGRAAVAGVALTPSSLRGGLGRCRSAAALLADRHASQGRRKPGSQVAAAAANGGVRRGLQSAPHKTAAGSGRGRLPDDRRHRDVPGPGLRAIRVVDWPKGAARRDAAGVGRE